jgi:acyl-CoA thioesterase FadM
VGHTSAGAGGDGQYRVARFSELVGRPAGPPRHFVRPARFDDLLTVAVRVANVGRKSVTYAFEFFRDDELLARGRVTSVCCRVHPDRSFESAEIPESLRAKLAQAS